MTTDLDIRWSFDWFEGAEERQFDLDFRQLDFGDRREPRVRATGFYRASRDDLWKRFVGFDMADTSTQFVSLVERDECAAKSQGHFSSIDSRSRGRTHMPGNRRTRDAKKQFTFDVGRHSSSHRDLSVARKRSKRPIPNAAAM